MEDLTMHLWELIQNSLQANAHMIHLSIIQTRHFLKFKIIDDGIGFSNQTLPITSFRYTTHSQRKFGFGLAFLQQLVQQTNGKLQIRSFPNQTRIIIWLMRDHIDLPPIGNLGELVKMTLHARKIHFILDEYTFQNHFHFDSKQYQPLDSRSIQHPFNLQKLQYNINQKNIIKENLNEKLRRFKKSAVKSLKES